jgi:hypothetical protein
MSGQLGPDIVRRVAIVATGKGKGKGKVEEVAYAAATRDYVETASKIVADFDAKSRALVGRYFVWMTRSNRPVSARAIALSISEGKEQLGLLGKRDPLQWSPSWAGRIPTVHAMMNLSGAANAVLDDMFAIAEDLRVVTKADGKQQGHAAAVEFVRSLSDDANVAKLMERAEARLMGEAEGKAVAEFTEDMDDAAKSAALAKARDEARAKASGLSVVQALRAATPRKPQAPRKSPDRDPETFDPAVELIEVMDALAAYIAKHDGTVPSAVSLAIGEALETLRDMHASVRVC